MPRGNAPTLKDVAREAGVSAMTVSVVLNGARSATRVSGATRARIVEAAARLRYRPNAAARGLQRRRMDTIGVAAIVDGGEPNLYFLELFNGILEGAREHGQNTTVFSIGDWKRDEARLLQGCDGRVDGMILIAPDVAPAFGATLRLHTPFVTIHSNVSLPGIHNLDVDNEGGGYAAVRHLIERGHRRILHLTGALALADAQQRLAGYRRALAEAGIPVEESYVVPCYYEAQSARRETRALLDRCAAAGEALPTAIFCGNDAMASGCIEVLSEWGVSVPRDVSVVGFDDILAARMTQPPLTTVRQPFRRMGRRAAELLLAQIGGPEEEEVGAPSPPPTTGTGVCAVELVERASVGPPPEAPIVVRDRPDSG